MHVTASLVSYPPRRFIGSELMTHRMLQALQGRGHSVEVWTQDPDDPREWEGIPVRYGGRETPQGDVCVYHPDWSQPVENFPGKRVAVCHNSRMAVQVGVYNSRPDLLTVNSEVMRRELRHGRQVVVHPPVEVPVVPRNGSRVTVVNLEESNKVGPFWELVRLMPDVDFLGVKGGYGKQSVPRGRPRGNVTVIDHVSAGEMAERVWAETRVLLVPSATESWSMAASEAMSHGIPVIANPLPGLIENLQGVGLWADREQAWQWVHQIRTVLAGWDDYSTAALERAKFQAARFNREVTAWCEEVERL